MNERALNRVLLLSSSVLLPLGFYRQNAWAIAGVMGLIPSLWWVAKEIRSISMGSDALAAISLTASLLTSEYLAAAIISLMLGSGRVLENWAEGQAERQLNLLISRVPTHVRRISPNGDIEEILISEMHIGDQLLVRSGEITPTDGVLLSDASLDESALTGEPLPVSHQMGQLISSGVVNAGSPFTMTAATQADQSTYSRIIELVKQSRKESVPTVRIANTFAIYFLPVAIIVAIAAYLISGEISHSVAVLVAATPCPLILAVPIAIVAGLSRSAQHGAIIKGGGILEKLSRAEVVLLDKTGTLTHGGPQISNVNTDSTLTVDEAVAIAASIDAYSPHIVAKAIVKESEKRSLQLLPVTEIKELAGHSISASLNGIEYTVGQPRGENPSWLTFKNQLMVALYKQDTLIALMGLNDPIRSESSEMVAQLRKVGVKEIALVTGDRDETAQEVALAVGISSVYSEEKPEGKLAITQRYKDMCNGSVVVVGDGTNDAPALALADVGVAMGAHGASAASEAADIVIVEDSIDRLTHAIFFARLARKKAMQAAATGMFLSICAMGLGAFGITSPSFNALAQELIDVVAIAWALTTLLHKPA